MKNVAVNFSAEMKRVVEFVDLITALFGMAKTPLTSLRCKRFLAESIKDVHARTRALKLGDSLALEGVYLSSCALFEQAVRDLIDAAAFQIVGKKPVFSDLPGSMQKSHLQGCIDILKKKQDKFSHLTPQIVITSMASCYRASTTGSYTIISEALSSHAHNFRSEELKTCIGRLGVQDLWRRLGSEIALQNLFGGTSPTDTMNFSKTRLDAIMQQRNQTMHRSPSFAPPAAKDVKECAGFLDALTESLANVLVSHVSNI